MANSVRAQIYATMPIEEVTSKLRRGIIPAPFVRRMRIINIISAITLRKIEGDMILPFDVMDLHHVLDKQISQDAIISLLENEALATAIISGDLRLLQEEAERKPLLKKGFEQYWIQRFILTPFDPICIMLALRARLLLDAIDELGHSYNLLRSLGLGWIDFGEIPGEDPGQPDSYVPPGIDQPIDYPEQYPTPGPEDPGYIPAPEIPGDIPPSVSVPGTVGVSGSPDTSVTLGFGPGSLLSQGWASAGRSLYPRNCCLAFEDPENFVGIGYEATVMDLSEVQSLTVEHADPECDGGYYMWLITAGGGSLSAETGLTVSYTAPASGHNCPGKTEITLFCGDDVMDVLEITINYDYAITFSYGDPELEIDREDSLVVSVVANNTPLTWTVEGTGFSLEHEETSGESNVLHADETACGSAKITITGCDGQEAIGHVRCTTGEWALIGSGLEIPCTLSGAATGQSGDEMWIIEGKHKLWEQINYTSSAPSCDDSVDDACLDCNVCISGYDCGQIPDLEGASKQGGCCCDKEDPGFVGCMAALNRKLYEWTC